MLYDPKWEQKTKADPFSLDGLIAWLETKDPQETYVFLNCTGQCLIGQYMNAIGIPWNINVESGHNYNAICGKLFGWRSGVIPNQSVASECPRTFGAALSRARALRDV